ncbi:MAG: UDP-N-acetylglucosamine 2-epimerase (non-hydrolyzing) [Rhodothermia bacterium]|nr:UDP-N-acetylglucosamine 2-epimerase (non-hydrolyzing) [Rhodothermia bacterium]
MSRHIYTVLGTRPQFVKATMVSMALARAGIKESIIHTGQHYDTALDRTFFEEIQMPPPVVNLGVGSGSHAWQVGTMMIRLEAWLLEQKKRPDAVLVYGDTNSTLAGALVAAKLNLPVAHIEAGLRSFNRNMPEETNRILTDAVARWCFCPTETAVAHLRSEGKGSGVFLCGDVMHDATRYFGEQAAGQMPTFGPRPYAVVTIHRAENTDDPARFHALWDALSRINLPLLWPLHPRTRHLIAARTLPPSLQILPPLGYKDMLRLVRNAQVVITDSGGLQKEAYWLGVPCITLRNETEWPETLHNDWNRLAGNHLAALPEMITQRPTVSRTSFGTVDGEWASTRIARILLDELRHV